MALIIPEDGFSSDVVRGIPAGLVDFLSPLQAAGMCRLAAQPTSIGLWTVYMHQYNVSNLFIFFFFFFFIYIYIFSQKPVFINNCILFILCIRLFLLYFHFFLTANTFFKRNVHQITAA